MTRIAFIATETVPGCDAASITLLRDGQPMTPAYTSPPALRLDETQYAEGDGPCLAAIRHRGVEHATMGSDGRWPAFEAAAIELGVLATFSVPLGNDDDALGALNLYSQTTRDYADDARDIACRFADQLGIAAARVMVYAESYELAQQLQEAMKSRATIEQAKGILMAAQRCSPDEAFEILVRASQNRNRKLREVAAEVVEHYTNGSGVNPAAN